MDLVLTYDFGLKHLIELGGGDAAYIDHLVSQAEMEKNNFLVTTFFQNWHKDANGQDVFQHRGIDFGFSFRLDIWNDLTFYARNRACLGILKRFSYEKLTVSGSLDDVCSVLGEMGVEYVTVFEDHTIKENVTSYYFPAFKWMDERIRPPKDFKRLMVNFVKKTQGVLMGYFDAVHGQVERKDRIFVQEYYPTKKILQCLKRRPGTAVLQASFSSEGNIFKKLCSERIVPIVGSIKKYETTANDLMSEFRDRRGARLILSDGTDITASVFEVLEKRIEPILAERLRDLVAVDNYLIRHPIVLKILIGNIGKDATLIDLVSNKRGVPTYMIINGLLGHHYEDDAKLATVINSYSKSIRDNYFSGMPNVIYLGDPRMDQYAGVKAKTINRSSPTVSIGTSGFSNIDLNSYLAVEFEFLYEVLSALSEAFLDTEHVKIILKVRSNGYKQMYETFVDDYFSRMTIRIEDDISMNKLFEKTDLYISLYSQTLIEAASLGIPCIYHKNDNEILYPPFDGESELVTTYSTNDLKIAINDFVEDSPRFEGFLMKPVLEKYVGFLDGKNLERNLGKIEELLK
ncbi:hypothetical protein OAD22_00040 [Pseudomonadales bacterium]|nr:hypothetical protein [Pseudomonadales bacterium]